MLACPLVPLRDVEMPPAFEGAFGRGVAEVGLGSVVKTFVRTSIASTVRVGGDAAVRRSGSTTPPRISPAVRRYWTATWAATVHGNWSAPRRDGPARVARVRDELAAMVPSLAAGLGRRSVAVLVRGAVHRRLVLRVEARARSRRSGVRCASRKGASAWRASTSRPCAATSKVRSRAVAAPPPRSWHSARSRDPRRRACGIVPAHGQHRLDRGSITVGRTPGWRRARRRRPPGRRRRWSHRCGALGHDVLDQGDVALPPPDPSSRSRLRVVNPAGLCPPSCERWTPAVARPLAGWSVPASCSVAIVRCCSAALAATPGAGSAARRRA